jgi:hypothetical protein
LIGTLIAYTAKNTIYIQVVLLVINGVTLTIIVFFMTESPKFLYSNGKYEECRQVLAKIARVTNHENNGALISKEI